MNKNPREEEIKSMLATKRRLCNKHQSQINRNCSDYELNKTIRKIMIINEKIEKLQKNDLIVSEHAILRYIERVMKIDLGQIVDSIATEKNKSLVKLLGSGKYPIGNGFKAVVDKNIVVTIIGD